MKPFYFRHEMVYIHKMNLIQGVFYSIRFLFGQLLACSTLISYAILEGRIAANLAFMTLAWFALVKKGVPHLMAKGVQFAAEMLVTLRRLQVGIRLV